MTRFASFLASLAVCGALILPRLTATAWSVSAVTPCESADGTCDDSHVCSIAGQSCSTVPGANVSFTVADGVNPPVAFGLAFVFNRH